jgi:hypothetical protein
MRIARRGRLPVFVSVVCQLDSLITHMLVLLEELFEDAGLRCENDFVDFVIRASFDFECEVGEHPCTRESGRC